MKHPAAGPMASAHRPSYGRSLLVLTPSFPNQDHSFITDIFVKNQLEPLKGYFREIAVIAPVLSSGRLMAKDRLCHDYSYDNISVYYPRCFYIPLFYTRGILIDNRLPVVRRCIEKNQISFDLIHAHFTWPCGYIAARLKEESGVPAVLTVHENSSWLAQEIEMHHPLLDAAWSGADAVIRVNRTEVPLLAPYNRNVHALPNGFLPRFHPMDMAACRAALSLPADKKIIFSLGWIIRRKGFRDLIEAVALLSSKRDDLFCIIGGTGPDRRVLESRIRKAGLGDRVKLIGFVQDRDLPLWMNAADLFVLPSLAEGNPTVMFEALGCGRPFVGSAVGGVPEIIVSEDYGLLSHPGDPGQLAEVIGRALEKEWDPAKISTYARQFSWERIGAGIREIYAAAFGDPAAFE